MSETEVAEGKPVEKVEEPTVREENKAEGEENEDELEHKGMDPRLPWKITLVLCTCITIVQIIVLIVLMLSFVKGGAVFKKIVRIDNRYDNAALCEPLPLD